MSVYLQVNDDEMEEITVIELKRLKEIIQDDFNWSDAKGTKKDLKAIDRVLEIYGN